jgi:translation initiation factor 2 beta subunit (eIF-2beta)/eIF-5
MASDPLRAPRERRHNNRLVLPPCRDCGNPDTKVALRLEYVIYLTCEKCGLVWAVRKPRPEE